MNLSRFFPHRGAEGHHLVGHIADVPRVVEQLDPPAKIMVFHIAEAANLEFHLTMLPTTPARHKGDRVELVWTRETRGTAIVDTLYSAPDIGEIRRRNAEYLHKIVESASRGPQ